MDQEKNVIQEPEKAHSKKKIIIERTIIFVLALAVIGLLVFFMWDIFVPFIKLEIAQDTEAAKELLVEKGWLGWITVSLVEALQMVVIFIPAEFIQISSGMSYPWWLAIILCDIGVTLGGAIIYLLVNVFRFSTGSNNAKVNKFARMSKTNNTMILMYLLFIMPIIPFGAICYYGSSKKIPFHRYIITVCTGVIPSIVTSILMGTAVKEFIANSLPIWALILIIIGAGAVLFILLLFVLKKFFFKQGENTPDSIFYGWIFSFARKVYRLKNKFVVIGREKMADLEGPYFLLCNHHSAIDPFALSFLEKDRHYAYVFNKYYIRVPFFGKLLLKSGFIPKKMFTSDFDCANKIVKTIKAEYPVVIFPEARLSTDGGPSHIDDSTARVVSYFKVPLVLVQIRRAYFNKPKWRKKSFRGKVEVEVMEVIQPDEVAKLGVAGVQEKIINTLSFNEFDITDVKYKRNGKAQGLENILYMCPHCGEMYTNIGKGDTLTCSHCGKSYHIGPNYQFDDPGDIRNIRDYYQKIKEMEMENIDNFSIDLDVDTVIFDKTMKNKRNDKGTFHMDSEKVIYKSLLTDVTFEYETKKMEGIAYSVNEEFEMYYQDELYYFYPPKGQRTVCSRIALLQELLKAREDERRKQERQ